LRQTANEKKRILLIGERPDLELFATLGKEGYEVAALESPCRASALCLSYRPHVVVVHLRYPRDRALLEECLAMPGKVPVVAAISTLARQTLVQAVKEKAASFVVLPVKPKSIRETLQSLERSENEGSTGAQFLQPREKEPAQGEQGFSVPAVHLQEEAEKEC
jgi:DNA-binding NtrC family response regulator